METDKEYKIVYLPTGTKFYNRLEAKMVMSTGRFNKAVKAGDILFINQTY